MKEHNCQFCGRTDSLNFIDELGVSVCSGCWEGIAVICQKMLQALMTKALRDSLVAMKEDFIEQLVQEGEASDIFLSE